MATDTQATSLIINRLTKAQYDTIETKSNTELYLIPDEIDSVPTYQSTNVISSGGVYGAIQSKAEDSQVVKLTGNQTVAGTKTFSAEVKMTSGGTSDICSGVACAFKANRAQVTNFITHDIYTGGTDSTTPITFYKYTAVASSAPSTTVQLAKIDTDGNIYESTTKLSDKYQATLVSGTNIKTINNESILGQGNISVSGGSGEANVIESISVNSVAQTVTNKNVDITVPTKVSDLNNDSGFTTNTGTLTGVKFNNVDASVSNGIASITATIPSAVTESTVSGWGFTKNAGTLTGVKFNNADATVSNGVASITATIPAAPGTLNTNNSTAQTAASSEALSDTIKLHKVAKTGTYSDLIGTPTIPTESTVSGWGFTKNAGTLTGVTFNGSAATVSSGVAAITATIPNITISSSEPTSSQGSNGDIWIVV